MKTGFQDPMGGVVGLHLGARVKYAQVGAQQSGTLRQR